MGGGNGGEMGGRVVKQISKPSLLEKLELSDVHVIVPSSAMTPSGDFTEEP